MMIIEKIIISRFEINSANGLIDKFCDHISIIYKFDAIRFKFCLYIIDAWPNHNPNPTNLIQILLTYDIPSISEHLRNIKGPTYFMERAPLYLIRDLKLHPTLSVLINSERLGEN